jgi:predicted AAA+ superfamily ATPase
VFIDEVQECSNVVTMIKFLLERTDFDYVISGSMLGVELKSVKSVPAGYLSVIQMYPMDFEEFCWARGVSTTALDETSDAFDNMRPVDPYIHKLLLSTFHEYLYVGGMPAAVDAFVATSNLQTVRDRQGAIYEWYREDIAKYAGSQALVVKKIFDTLPAELNNQNKRFKISALEPKARLARYENDFIWLVDANVAIASYCATEPRAPLAASASSRMFKLFMCDVGLLTYAYGLETVRDMAAGRTDVKYGALYENAVAQELYSRRQNRHAPLYYFKSDRVGELDFLTTDRRDHVVPLEVKSGKSYKRHSALNNVLATENYDIQQAIVLCEDNVSAEGSVAYLPIYMAMFFGR